MVSALTAERAESSGWGPGSVPCMLTIIPMALTSPAPAHKAKHVLAALLHVMLVRAQPGLPCGLP